MITLKDIAKELNFNTVMVSRALSGKGYVKKEYADKIIKTAKEMGYIVNDMARITKTGKSNVVAFISDVDLGHDIDVFTEFLRYCTAQDYFVKNIFKTPDMTSQDVVDVCLRQKIAGVACRSMVKINELQQLLAAHSIPLAVVDYAERLDHGIHVVSDIEAGFDAAIDCLCRRGKKKFAYLCPCYFRSKRGEKLEYWAVEFYEVIKNSLQKHAVWDVGSPIIYDVPLYNENRYFDFLKDQYPAFMPDIIICETPSVSHGICHAAACLGIRVPENLSILALEPIRKDIFRELDFIDDSPRKKGRILAEELLKEVNRAQKQSLDQKIEITIPLELHIG